ncbi:hypothetical protein NDU88_004985 [Pleurodeles waltl]|uniref:Helically-extended SH3 domain-containing protein n=1 Tax=Pleurodeles waltl TaxID=8319 RepID=A0AAV7L2F7_PLEWA|nr:hypothetical protein NDU88_004985 [Pleurodeles waltl]
MEEKGDFKSLMAKFHTKTTEIDAGKFKPPIATKPAPPTNKSKPAIAPKKIEPENPYSPMYPVAAWRELTKELSSPNLKELAGGQIGSNINNSKLKVDATKKYNGDRSPNEASARTPLFEIGRQNTFKEINVNSTTQETGNSYTTRPLDFHHNLIMKLSQNPVGGNEIKRCPSKDHLPPKPLRLSPCNKPGVPPRKALPNPKQLGPRPLKPTRPPLVDLTRFTKGKGVMLMVQPANEKKMDFMKQKFEAKDLLSSLQHHPRISSTGSGSLNISSSSCEDREDYDDIETVRPMPKRTALSPAPPPKPKPKMSSSSKEDDFYDDVGSLETIFPPPPPQLRKSHEFRINWKNVIKQQREVEEKEFRKKFKFEGEIKVLTRMMVDPNAIIKKCGSYDLPHKRGDFLDVIQYTSQEKYLCRNIRWKFGYVPKRSLLSIEKDVYDDVGIFEELYDDIDLINKAMPPALPKMRKPSEAELYAMKQANEKNLKKLKKEEKEEKDIRKKFKLEGEIKVLTQMMVDPNAKIKKGGGKYLSHKRGEILEVIERTSLEKLLCRNSKGKYGYVPRLYLLQVEKDVYDYVEMSDIPRIAKCNP